MTLLCKNTDVALSDLSSFHKRKLTNIRFNVVAIYILQYIRYDKTKLLIY